MAQLPRMWRAWDFALLRSLAVRVSGDETPRSETKNFVTGGSASSMSFVFESLVPLALQVPRDAVRALNWPNCWGILHWGDPNAWSWLQMETLSSLYWTVNKPVLGSGEGISSTLFTNYTNVFVKTIQSKGQLLHHSQGVQSIREPASGSRCLNIIPYLKKRKTPLTNGWLYIWSREGTGGSGISYYVRKQGILKEHGS